MAITPSDKAEQIRNVFEKTLTQRLTQKRPSGLWTLKEVAELFPFADDSVLADFLKYHGIEQQEKYSPEDLKKLIRKLLNLLYSG